MRHLFFYGPSGAGKSFALRRALRDCHPGRVAGFCTHKSRSGGVYLRAADAPPLEADDRLVARVSQRPLEANAARFDALGTALLSSVQPGDLVLMDEIGFLERDAALFSGRILELLDRTDIRILGVCRGPGPRDTPLLTALRAHPNVTLCPVTVESRDAAYALACAFLNESAPARAADQEGR